MKVGSALDAAARVARTRAVRLWLCATMAGLLMVLIGAPETPFRALKSMVREHPASGRVVVVGIDDKSLAALGGWPLPRSRYATVINRAFEAGATDVFVSLNFPTAQTEREDAALAAAIASHAGHVFIGTRFTVDDRTGEALNQPTLTVLRRHARLVLTNYPFESNGDVWTLPYGVTVAGKTIPGLAAQAASRPSQTQGFFPVDTSIDLSSIPIQSLIDVVGGKFDRSRYMGSKVFIGLTSEQVPDLNVVRPYGRIPSVLIHALGAETLVEGRAVDLGPLPLAAAASALVLISIWLRRPTIRLATYLLGSVLVVGILLSVPTGIWVSVSPALTILFVAAGLDARKLLKDTLQSRATTNQISGLSNLTALRQLTAQIGRTLVVAQVHNFADALATLPDSREPAFISQIASRLQLGVENAELYHGDNGVFAWFESEDIDVIGDHLDGLHAMFRSPVIVGDQNIDLSVTFGIDTDGGRTVANRLGSALVAAAEAVADGLKWREFDKSKLADAAWKLSLLSQLDAAIDDGHLWVAYQPKLDLISRRIIGAEALVRWTHPEKGAISPIEFVAAAEQHNRIEKLTMHVLDRAVLAAATINAHGIPFGMAVNLSTRLLENHDIVDAVASALRTHALPARQLTLEITETATLSSGGSLDVLIALRDLGVRISIDDYGTGLSTLDYLKRIPASEIKIDKSFVQSILSGGSDLLMVNSTIQLAHSLGHVVVAEGVENDDVLARLADLQCDIAQGYRIGRPMTFQDLARRLLADRRHAA